ncbi:hypothetical protein [Leisingera sp.]|nr:hypothetical protein [Leisingera sp.]
MRKVVINVRLQAAGGLIFSYQKRVCENLLVQTKKRPAGMAGRWRL